MDVCLLLGRFSMRGFKALVLSLKPLSFEEKDASECFDLIFFMADL